METPRLYSDLTHLWPFLSPPEEYASEAAAFQDLLAAQGVREGARLLHLGSGGGSLDNQLAAFFQVTGVDLSPAMVALARQVNPGVEYLVGDMRAVRLGRLFDVVLIHDAIAYMASPDELLAAYRTAAAHLAPGGVLLAVPEQLRLAYDPTDVTTVTRTRGEQTVTCVELQLMADPADDWYETEFLFIVRQGMQVEVHRDRHRRRLFTLADFTGAITAAGFRLIDEPDPAEEEGGYPLLIAKRTFKSSRCI
jgi:SAM-dependent methyltransferase